MDFSSYINFFLKRIEEKILYKDNVATFNPRIVTILSNIISYNTTSYY